MMVLLAGNSPSSPTMAACFSKYQAQVSVCGMTVIMIVTLCCSFDGSSEDTPGRSGRRRYQHQDKRQDAPFAMFEGDNRQVAAANDSTKCAVEQSTGSLCLSSHYRTLGRLICVCLSPGRNGTPRSAGGRRKFEDKQQHQPAPFAVDDGSERQVPAMSS